MRRLRRFPWLAFAVLLSIQAASAQDFKKQVIYQIVTDRFFNGSKANDDPAVSKGLFDATKTNWQAYWGGDLQGIQAKMPYLKGMGITAVWISPVVDNENKAMSPPGSLAPYHGYHTRDFMKVDEHFGDPDNGWTTFDRFIASAHSNGIKVVLDWANNHSNDAGDGEKGALFNNGTLIASASNDPGGVFHHNPDMGGGDFDDRYRAQYFSLSGLTDLNQENSTVDAYLKSAAQLFQAHGVDAFRLDALKHVNWGWEYSFANAVFSNKPSFLFGEWITDIGNPLYHDATKFANRSGINELDFAVNRAARDVFASDKSFSELEETITTENKAFVSPNDLVVFFDSHDEARLLSMNNKQNRVNEALAFTLTCRGIPVVMYGDEQHLHNDTNGGNDPFNRVQMSAWSTTTTAYKLVKKLATLRQTNDALGYGLWQQRFVSDDVYIFERKFFGNVVLVAINKNETDKKDITGLLTSLPPGTYADFLGKLMSGRALAVSAGSNGNNPAGALTLPAHSVSVWQVTAAATTPQVGSIGPMVGQPGMSVTIAGDGFGTSAGSIKINGAAATVTSWSNTSVTFTVPIAASGVTTAVLSNASGTAANPIQFTVLEAKLVPVTFTVNNAAHTSPGDFLFLSGEGVTLGNWGTTYDTAVGPMLTPNFPNWFLNVSVPAGQTIEFKFIKIAADGTVTWEGGSNHKFTVPASGTGSVNVDWQN